MSNTVLFDLDGTLIDHFSVLFRCYDHTLTRLERPIPSAETVRRSVGGSMEVTMSKFVPEGQIQEAAQIWRTHFDKIFLEEITLLPGAVDIIQQLHVKGTKLAVFTNKIGSYSRAICQHLKIAPYLSLILGADDTPFRKPDREFSQLALDRLGTTSENACLIGDSPFDIKSAQTVGMKSYCVTTGTHSREELSQDDPDGIFHSLPELAEAVFDLTLPLSSAV
ncbi:MAG: HAD family hydrolase [Opitutaceae bacterium]|nr:HAD family hydrolase [Opitutaceae bacterium]